MYEAQEDLTMVKVVQHDGDRMVGIVEEPKFFKILKKEGSNFVTHSEYFVSNDFATTHDV